MDELQKFLKSLPGFAYGICADAETLNQAKHLLLLEMDAWTDEPIHERENCCAIKTQKQYEKAKTIYGGHPK